jgi:hypothetical protein
VIRAAKIPGIRTRLDVVADRLLAGVPFYWHLEGSQVAISETGWTFMGRPVKVVDRDGDHVVLKLDKKAGRP